MPTAQPFLPAFATIAGALIAALVAFLVTVLTKEQKTSEFRQQWIDGLRSDLSDLSGEVIVLSIISNRLKGQALKQSDVERHLEMRYANLVKARSLITGVELRLNKSEHGVMLAHLTDLRDSLGSHSDHAVEVKLKKLMEVSKPVLKDEWERVKAGEPTFRRTKHLALRIVQCLMLLGLALLFLYIWTIWAT